MSFSFFVKFFCNVSACSYAYSPHLPEPSLLSSTSTSVMPDGYSLPGRFSKLKRRMNPPSESRNVAWASGVSVLYRIVLRGELLCKRAEGCHEKDNGSTGGVPIVGGGVGVVVPLCICGFTGTICPRIHKINTYSQFS